MVSLNDIKEVVSDAVTKYPIKKVSLFGSYAEGTASEESDIDLLVEFFTPNVSLFMIHNIKDYITSKLHKEVDIVHAPLDHGSLIKIDRIVDIYEQ